MRRIILAVALAGVLAGPAFGQGVDPLIGTWKMSPEKSTFVGQTPPKSMGYTFTGEGQNFTNTRYGCQGATVQTDSSSHL
jgi:hypothetical protein